MKKKAVKVQLRKLTVKQNLKKTKKVMKQLEEGLPEILENDFYGTTVDASASELFNITGKIQRENNYD
jgi:hypothetical protein